MEHISADELHNRAAPLSSDDLILDVHIHRVPLIR